MKDSFFSSLPLSLGVFLQCGGLNLGQQAHCQTLHHQVISLVPNWIFKTEHLTKIAAKIINVYSRDCGKQFTQTYLSSQNKPFKKDTTINLYILNISRHRQSVLVKE